MEKAIKGPRESSEKRGRKEGNTTNLRAFPGPNLSNQLGFNFSPSSIPVSNSVSSKGPSSNFVKPPKLSFKYFCATLPYIIFNFLGTFTDLLSFRAAITFRRRSYHSRVGPHVGPQGTCGG
jgi:hypothetical protein